MHFKGLKFSCLLALVLMVSLSVADAQVDTGSIYGAVTDPTGAQIPKPKIRITSEQTAAVREIVAESNGTFTASQLHVGTYTVAVEAPGFKTSVQHNVNVAVTETTRIDVVLAVGEVTESVDVKGTGAQISVETKDNTLGSVIEERRVTEMPLNGRNFIQLSYFVPGVTVNYRPITLKGSPTNVPGGVQVMPSVNGSRNTMNAVLIDGALNNDPVLNTAAIVPVPDAIQEFKIQTNLYSAEFGQGGGSVINIVTKSGTEHVHGTAYYFGRNDALDAHNYFLTTKPRLQRHQFGATFGAPLKALGLGKSTFIFGTYEGFRQNKSVLLNSIVPSLAFRTGDFSSLATPLKDPIGGCISGNHIAQSCMDPVAVKLISKLWPLPSSGATGFQAGPISNLSRNQFLIKGDHYFLNNSLSGRYAFDDGLESLPVSGVSGAGVSSGTGVPGFPVTNPSRFQNAVISDTQTLSNVTVNQTRFAYLRTAFGNNILVSRDNPTSFGFTYPISQFPSLPAISVAGVALTGPPAQKDFTKRNNIFLWADSVSHQTANHSFSFGGEIRRSRVDVNAGNFTNGLFTFSGINTGNAFADYLLGDPQSLLQVEGDAIRNFRSTSYGLFFQDNYHLTHNVTLNYGLRYEVFGPFGDPYVHQIGHPRLGTFIAGEHSTYAPDLPTGLVLASFDPGVRSTIVATDYNNFAPRIGLAWDPRGNGNTSVRAGYGVFYDAGVLDGVINSTDGTSSIRPAASPFLPGPNTMADPYKGRSPFNPPITFPIPTTTSLAPTIVDPNIRTPYAQQWNLTVQQQIPWKLLGSVGYVGTKGTKLTGAVNQAQACFASVANPCNGLTTDTSANLNARRPYPGITGLTTVFGDFNSTYNGLQTSLSRAMSKGLAFQFAYTWSKTMDVTSQPNSFYAIQGQTNLQDNYNPAADRSLSAFDVRNRFVSNFSYELPFGKQSVGYVRQIIGGWQLNGIVTVQGGSPFTVFDSSGRSLTGSGADRPDQICNPILSNPTPAKWINTSCFQQIPPGLRFGTARRNIVFTDGIKDVDGSLFKLFHTSETTQLEFRMEVFNLFNHPDFGTPINDFASPAFGRVLATSADERQLQFALKFKY